MIYLYNNIECKYETSRFSSGLLQVAPFLLKNVYIYMYIIYLRGARCLNYFRTKIADDVTNTGTYVNKYFFSSNIVNFINFSLIK